ncbi:MAG: glycosyltransferase family 2 protein [Clostridiales bacterium]|nr:glycosyltransferase family 2 protein [Clostridiales bacterium]
MNSIPVLTNILWFVSLLLVLYSAYYILISAFSLKKPIAYEQTERKNRFAAIIAARNEAQVIGNLVQSLKAQKYPEDLFEIIVIPNNCTDNTGEAALQAGATIMECTEKVKSKGQVLSFAFKHLMKEDHKFDAFCIFDADNLVDPGFLNKMNNVLNSGGKVAQGYRESKNPTDSFIASTHSIYYYMNGLYNRARSILGLSAVITGTGFMVSADVITQLGGWNTKTMTEDLEFTALCLLEDIKIHWVQGAVVYDEQPLRFKQSWDQRLRWTTGNLQCVNNYLKPLAKKAATCKSKVSLDMILLLIAPYVQILGFVSVIMTLILNIARVKYHLFPQTDLFVRCFGSFDGYFFSSTAIAAIAVILEKKGIWKMFKGIMTFWILVVSWIPINIICIFKKSTEWKQIEHTRKLTISDF